MRTGSLEPTHPSRLLRVANELCGLAQRMRGLRFEANDTDWSWGDAGAPLVRGPAEAILMSTLGRGQALVDCEGDGIIELKGRTN